MAGESCGGGGWCGCDVEGNCVPGIGVFGVVEVGIEVVICIWWRVGSDCGLTVWGCLGWNGPACGFEVGVIVSCGSVGGAGGRGVCCCCWRCWCLG